MRDSILQTKSTVRENMTISALHAIFCNNQSILERHHIIMGNVRNLSTLPQASLYIKKFIPELNPAIISFVKNPLSSMQVLKCIKHFKLGKKLTNAKNVESLFLNYLILTGITESMLVKDLTNVRYVTNSLP